MSDSASYGVHLIGDDLIRSNDVHGQFRVKDDDDRQWNSVVRAKDEQAHEKAVALIGHAGARVRDDEVGDDVVRNDQRQRT